MMIYESGDIILLDNKKNIILTMFNENNTNYAFVNTVSDDEENITEDYYLIIINGENDFTKIVDEQEINRFFPLIQKKLKEEMDKNGIEVDLGSELNE